MVNLKDLRGYLSARFFQNKASREHDFLFEPLEWKKFLFSQSVLNEGDLAIDLGAHMGTFAIFFARCVGQNGKVIAFEPNPYVFRILHKRTKRKKYIQLLNRAVSDTSNQELDFYIEPYKLFLCGTLNTELVIKERFIGQKKKIKVLTKSLDDLSLDRPVKLMKVDVEGHEESVFKGARKILEKDKPLIIFEFTKTDKFISKAHEFLKIYNYICYDFKTMKEFSIPDKLMYLTDLAAIHESVFPQYQKKLLAISELKHNRVH